MLGKYKLQLVVAVDTDNGIGYKNELLFKDSDDLKHFAKLTANKVVICGRKTYQSLPRVEGAVLKGREIIVLSRQSIDDLLANNIIDHSAHNIVYASYDQSEGIEEFLEEVLESDEGLQEKAQNGIVVIGGAEIYKLLMPYVDEAFVSEFIYRADAADTWFPLADFTKYMSYADLTSFRNFELTRYTKKII